MSTILETAEVRAMIPNHEAPNEWFSFYSPDEAIEIRCTERESEDFERYTGVRLGADVIEDQATFDRLRAYLAEECGLCDADLAIQQIGTGGRGVAHRTGGHLPRRGWP